MECLCLIVSFKNMENAIRHVAKILAILGSVSLVVMAVVTTADVVGRNFFNAPMKGALEIVSVCLTLALFGGMPYAEILNEHIRVDILTCRFSTSVQNALESGMNWLYFLLMGVLSWQCWDQACFLLARNSNSGVMGIPLAPFMFAVSVILAVYCIAVLCNFIKSFVKFIEGERNWFLLIFLMAFGLVLIVLSINPDLSPVLLEDSTTGLLSLLLLFVFLGLPIGAAMALSCLVAMSHLLGAQAGLSLLGMASKTVASNYSWSVAPLFIFMGVLVSACRFSQDIFDMAYKWLGHMKGGLASATIGACSIFAAVVGDSLSGVVTMGSISIPEMKKYNMT